MAKDKNNSGISHIFTLSVGMAIGAVVGMKSVENSAKATIRFDEAAEQIQSETMQPSADTTYTKDGEIADIKRDTTYVVTKADFNKLRP